MSHFSEVGKTDFPRVSTSVVRRWSPRSDLQLIIAKNQLQFNLAFQERRVLRFHDSVTGVHSSRLQGDPDYCSDDQLHDLGKHSYFILSFLGWKEGIPTG